MKKLLTSAILLFFAINFSIAQDTTIVQTLDFNDITKRRGWYIFPQDTSYQKVLMYYTLKCDAATTQDQYACGEWDYTTFTNLYQHENIGSSRYLINGSYPDTINYVTNPTYTYYEQNQYFIVYDGVTSQADYSVGAGTTPVNHTFNSSPNNGKAQYLWLASELSASTLGAGTIDKLKLDFTSLGSDLNNLTINIKHSGLSSLSESNYETTGFTEVYNINTIILGTGIQTLNLTTPFIWDGASNVVVEFSFSNSNSGTGHILNGDVTASNMGIHSTQDDGYLDFQWGNYVNVPAAALANVSNEITVSFWQYGDVQSQPLNNYIFEGRDANNYRVVNAHLPWSNSSVYWDAGNSGTNSYDRINQAANFSDFAGQWNHWVFTKNSTTGDHKIYLNGALWHSGTGLTRTMAGITDFTIGGNAGSSKSGRYDGAINNFEIWNKELDLATIQNWMNKDIDGTHPFYSNLQAYYKFDDMMGAVATDASGNGFDGDLIGMPSWRQLDGTSLHRNFAAINERPNIAFTQGVYTTHLDSILVTDSVMNQQVSIIQYGTSIDINNAGITLTEIDTTYGWESGWIYTYDQYGNAVDSAFISNTGQFINEYNQTTFQLQNYVTPYGIGLSLGANGFRWVYDVTDYQHLLSDTVEISAGNQQELIDLKFVMIKGIPPRDIIKVESIWNGDYGHANIANDVSMPAVNVDLDPTASSFRIKTRTSGHWFGGFQNCAEFCPKLHHVDVDGTMRFQWNNWKACGDNPVGSQGGTWVYDRAGWCPGAFTDTYDHELTPFVTPGTTISLDYGMETTAGGMEGNYRTTMQLVTYGANNFNLDVRVDEIISPNSWEFRRKVNPICADPQIVIQNTGTTTVTSMTISYKVVGGFTEHYNWTGSLGFMEKEQVTIPIQDQAIWNTTASQDIFEVTVSGPNGLNDQYPENNTASSPFTRPDVYSNGIFYMRTSTNAAGFENSYTIKDDQGNVVMSRPSMANSTVYNDTINLPDGCYVLDFLDSDGDGMSFFANSDGNGTISFRWVAGAPWIYNFDAQFGSFFKYYFQIDNVVGINSYDKYQEIEVFPNPSHDIFNISITGFDNETVNVGVYNVIGEVLYSESVTSKNDLMKTSFDLSDIPDGIYFIRVIAENGYTVKKIVKN